MSETITMTPIGWVKSPRKKIEDDNWGEVLSEIELNEEFISAEAAIGLETFSHIEVIFFMDQVKEEKIQYGARHPRNNRDLPYTGILAQRAKSRPNRIGLTRCKVISVNQNIITVQGLDAINHTPVLDIKPWFEEFAPQGQTHQPEWTRSIMSQYW